MTPRLCRSALQACLFLSLALLAAAPATAAQIDDPGFFVRQHYLDFLERAADAPGEAFWTGEITQCGGDPACMARKRIDVARAFFFSTDFINLEQQQDPYGRRRLDDSARNTPDYNEAFVDAAYRRYWKVQRPANDTLVAYLNAGIPNADYNKVIRDFITDTRYRGRFDNTPFSNTLDANRNRLFNDWAARNGQSNVCQAWANLNCEAKGAFITLTHRLQVSYLADYKTPLDHVDALYAILGNPGQCGGDGNRIFASMDDYLWYVMAYSTAGYVMSLDQNGNNYWTLSNDPAGPHDPFDASGMTSYGHPRGQSHFWISDEGFWTPVWHSGVPGIVDANMLEFDQDYDWNHPSSTECTYDTDGCDTCNWGTNKAGFSDGTGRMIYGRQHPLIPGWFSGPDFEWAPLGCERQWCGGCNTCEAQTTSGYQLGYRATSCAQVPCGPETSYACTLDGGKKVCSYPNGWVPAN